MGRSLFVFVVLVSSGLASVTGAAVAGAAAPQAERRCGWFSNPTPGNLSLFDRDGEWVIGVQGGHQAQDSGDWPSFRPGQWVEQNGHYGYGCACLEMRADPASKEVLAYGRTWARPLAACRHDPGLRQWREMFK